MLPLDDPLANRTVVNIMQIALAFANSPPRRGIALAVAVIENLDKLGYELVQRDAD